MVSLEFEQRIAAIQAKIDKKRPPPYREQVDGWTAILENQMQALGPEMKARIHKRTQREKAAQNKLRKESNTVAPGERDPVGETFELITQGQKIIKITEGDVSRYLIPSPLDEPTKRKVGKRPQGFSRQELANSAKEQLINAELSSAEGNDS